MSVRCCRAMWSSPSHRASRVIWIPVAILSAEGRSNHYSAQLEPTLPGERKGGLFTNVGSPVGLRQTNRQSREQDSDTGKREHWQGEYETLTDTQ